MTQKARDMSPKQTPGKALEPAHWVDAHGDQLYRYALVRVRDPDVAQDLVQETFLAALRSRDNFAGRSKLSTWLTGILRHKLLDYYRTRSKGPTETALDSHEDFLAGFFDQRGRWIEPPDKRAVRPDELLDRDEFWAVFDRCLDGLPLQAREAFVRRVLEDEDTNVICKNLGISTTNLYVVLFRARTRMRRCLTVNWFEQE